MTKETRKYLAMPIECDFSWEPSHLLDVPTGANFWDSSGEFRSSPVTRASLFQTLSEAMNEVARQNAVYLEKGELREWNVVAEVGEPTEHFFTNEDVYEDGGKLSCHSEYPICIVTFSARQGAKYGSVQSAMA